MANRPGYRVSWQSSLGVPTESVFEDNRDVWSGDHCSLDPDLVRGVFFASRPVPREPGARHRRRHGLGAGARRRRRGRRRGGKAALVTRRRSLAVARSSPPRALVGPRRPSPPPTPSAARTSSGSRARIGTLKAQAGRKREERGDARRGAAAAGAAARDRDARGRAARGHARGVRAAARGRFAGAGGGRGRGRAARARRSLARARLLQRFGRFGYFRVLLEARDVPALLDSIERLDGARAARRQAAAPVPAGRDATRRTTSRAKRRSRPRSTGSTRGAAGGGARRVAEGRARAPAGARARPDRPRSAARSRR